MAKTASSERKPVARLHAPGGRLYLCCFNFAEVGEKEYEGTFQIIVEGRDPGEALDRCVVRIKALRRKKTLFDSPVTIFVQGIIELNGTFESGLFVNVETRPAAEDRWTIYCTLPEQEKLEAVEYGLGEEPTGEEGRDVEPFLDFGGVAARKALHASGSRTSPVGMMTPSANDPSAVASKEATKQRALRRLETERANMLAATLAELDSDKPTRSKKFAKTSKRA